MDQGRRPVGETEIRFAPGEEFELAVDPRGGISSQLPEGGEALILTSQRVVRIGRDGKQRTVTAALLDHVDAVEVRHVERPPQRLYWSLLLAIIGIALSIIIWVLLEVPLLALLVGGVIAVVGLWLLLTHVLGEEEGHLYFQAGGQRICLPLYTRHSTDGAYQVCNRFFQLAQSHRTLAPTPDSRQTGAIRPQTLPLPRSATAPPEPAETPIPTVSSSSDPTPAQGLPDERKVLLEKLEAERAPLLGLVRHAPEEVAERNPWEGEWSVKQTLAHVAEVERVFVAEAVRGAEGDSPDVGYPGEGQWSTAQEGANQRPMSEILVEMARTREATIRAIQGISDQALLTLRVRHRRMGEVTLLQLLRVLYRHDRTHAEQVERTLRTLSPAT